MKAIFKKEFMSYFKTPLGWVFLSAFLLVSGLIFNSANLLGGDSSLQGVFSNIITICTFLIPVLTMRLLSEERNQKTDQVLFTAPVSVSRVVIGKYFAAVAVFGLALASTLLYLFVLAAHGAPPYAETFGSYLGFFLLGMSLIAIGTFISSLTESQVVSAISTFFAVLAFFMLDLVKQVGQSQALAKFIDWISITARFSDFLIGVLNIAPIVYYLSFSTLFIVFTIAVLEKRRIS